MSPWMLLCFFAVTLALLGVCKSNRASLNPQLVCLNFSASSDGHGSTPGDGNGGFKIVLPSNLIVDTEGNRGIYFEHSTRYEISLEGTPGQTFSGFLIQACVPGTMPGESLIGTFRNVDSELKRPYQQFVDCRDLGNNDTNIVFSSTVSHKNNNDTNNTVYFTQQNFTWEAPNATNISNRWVEFRYTVLENMTTYYENIHVSQNSDNYVYSSPPDGNITLPPTTPPPTTPPPTTPPPTTPLPTTPLPTTPLPTTPPPTTPLPTTPRPTTPLPITPPPTTPLPTTPRPIIPPPPTSPRPKTFATVGAIAGTTDSGDLSMRGNGFLLLITVLLCIHFIN